MSKPLLKPKPGKVKVFRATHDYNAKFDDELSFSEGDLIYIFEQSSDGWWKGTCKGKSGLIPNTYLTEDDEVKQPLHDAVRRGNIELLKEYLDQGVSSTGLDAMSNTALYWAASSGHLDCLNVLLSLPNAPVNNKNLMGDTALHAAAARGHFAAVQALIEKCADVTLKNLNGETAEDLTQDLGIKNLLHSVHPSRNSSSKLASALPLEYEDDSD